MVDSQTDAQQYESHQGKALKKPLNVVIDQKNLQIAVNGYPINYGKQTLTQSGLQISKNNNSVLQQYKISVLKLQAKSSLQFDSKLSQYKYCIQLANSLDRSSNSAAIIHKRSKSKGRIDHSPTAQYSLEICQYFIKKIPPKARCFENVFKNLQIVKIQVLLENNSFYLKTVKLIIKILFKIDIQKNQDQQHKQKNDVAEYLKQNLSDDSKSKSNSNTHQKNKKRHKKNNETAQFQNQVIKLYKQFEENIKIYKMCYERVNLLLKIFIHQNQLYNFLNEICRKLIVKQLNDSLPKMLNIPNSQSQQKQFNTFNSLQISQTLQKLIAIIRTIYSCLGKSELAIKTIKQVLMDGKQFSDWIKCNVKSINRENICMQYFIQLMALMCQINLPFVSNLFIENNQMITSIVHGSVRKIYQTLNSQFRSQAQKQLKMQRAYQILDFLVLICRYTIKQTVSSVNIGRVICKIICDTATSFRPVDIQLLTYACYVNHYSRQSILRCLFSYYRKFVRNLKSACFNCINKRQSIKIAKNNKHHLLQIIQSIRKVSQIQSIQFSIDSDFLQDIKIILNFIEGKAFPQQNDLEQVIRTGRNCIISALNAMLKKVQVQSKQKQVSTPKQKLLA